MKNSICIPFLVALCAASCAAGPHLLAQAVESAPVQGTETGVDATIKPGDDFFAYANGDWLKTTAIPAGLQRWSARNELEALTHRQVTQLLSDAAVAPAGTVARKVADYRSAYLDESSIEARGLAPVAPLLSRIDSVKDKTSLARLLGEGTQADVDPLNWGVFNSSSPLGLSVEPGINGEKNYVAFLLQGGLGLPNRDNYVSVDPAMQTLRAAYKDYIGKMLGLSGFDRAAPRAEAVMALETSLAQTQAIGDAAESDHNASNLWARADFAREAPGMDWSEFLKAAGLSDQESLVAWQPSAVKGLASLVASQPLSVWQDYLRFHVLDRYADVLPRAYAEPALALHGLALNGQPTPPIARDQRALAQLQLNLGDALGQMYAERYFPAEQKARLQAVATNVVAALRRRVAAEEWMTPATRELSVGKLQTLYVGLGYPEKWRDYSDLSVHPQDAAGNLRRAEESKYRHALALLGQPVDLKEWWMTAQMVGGILIFQENNLEFPAALLQPPKFDPQGSDAATYGAIGAIIGHESSHFVDPLGADYEAGGRKRHWWTDDDAKRFKVASEPLVKQYSAYKPFPDLAINGNLTSSENIADLAGLSAAFEAYRLTLGGRASDKDYVHQQDRIFFISFARALRSKQTEAALRKQAETNDHAPETYRVSTVRNLDAWYDAFDVAPSQHLYLEPSARVKVW